MPQQTADFSGHFAAIVSSSDDAIVSKDLNGVILSWNAAAERMFGYKAAEAIGRHITLIIPKDRLDEETYVIGQIRSGAAVEHYETIRQRKDGSLIEISLSVSPIHDRTGKIVGASKIARDITERKQLERTAAEASRAKDEFLATLSHELRTPLNTVMGYVQMLRQGSIAADEQPRVLEVINRNATMLARLVNDVLDTSRIVTGKMQVDLQPCRIETIVDEAVASMRPAAEAKGITLEQDVDPTLVVQCDAVRLGQVFWNLLSNAVKFTPAGGRVSITAREERDRAVVVVEDTGIGIAAGDLPLIFQRFWQAPPTGGRQFGGLGLGLALARHFVELHGGRIGATSDGPGRGTRIEIELPLRPSARNPDPTSSTA
jgi:PAS domain S-box-containing protein